MASRGWGWRRPATFKGLDLLVKEKQGLIYVTRAEQAGRGPCREALIRALLSEVLTWAGQELHLG